MSWNIAAMYSSQWRSRLAMRRLHSGYSCANSSIVKRRTLRRTVRMCWSTVYTWKRSCCIWPTMRRKAGRYLPRMPYWFMRRNSCTMPRGCCSRERKVARFRGSRRNAASMRSRAPERAQRLRRHALQLRVLLHDEKTLEDRGGLALEQIGGVRFEQFTYPPEFPADFRHIGIPRWKNLGTHVLQQYGVELGYGLRR